MERLSIGKMAKLNHVSEQTLRLYDRLDLLKPEMVDENNGYRYYDVKQSAHLDMIQYMKELGMPLKEIKLHMKQNNIEFFKSILEKQKDKINNQIKELQYKKKAINRTIDCYDRYLNSPPPGTITIEYINKRQIYLREIGVNFYDYGIETYEKLLRKFKEQMLKDSLPQVCFYNAGTIMKKDKLLNRVFESTEIFVLVDEDFVTENLITTIPSNMYICIFCNKFEDEIPYAMQLLEEIDKKGYEIVGDYICEVIAELPTLNCSERGMFLKLQIPIHIK